MDDVHISTYTWTDLYDGTMKGLVILNHVSFHPSKIPLESNVGENEQSIFFIAA
jgi:hypothetical protein